MSRSFFLTIQKFNHFMGNFIKKRTQTSAKLSLYTCYSDLFKLNHNVFPITFKENCILI
jgi:hypothetical protein